MTRLDVAPHHPKVHVAVSANRQPTVEQMLRDIAYVLHLTRRVKNEILAERANREARKKPAALIR
jgi:hypothetical protein